MMLFFAPTILGLLVLVVLTYKAFMRPSSRRFKIIVGGMLLGGGIPVGLSWISMNTSSSSTAGLGIFAIPFLLFYGVIAGAIVSSAFYLLASGLRYKNWKHVGLSLLIVLPSCLHAYKLLLVKYREVRMQNMPTEQVAAHLEKKGEGTLFIQETLALVKNPQTSSEVLEKIANSNDHSLHERAEFNFHLEDKATMSYIAQHPHVNIATLRKLSESPSQYVRQNVAFNDKTPLDVIQKFEKTEITKDWESPVARALLRHPMVTSESLKIYYEQILRVPRPEHLLPLLLSNRNVPEEILFDQLQRSKDLNYRVAIAANPVASKRVVDILIKDNMMHTYLIENPNLDLSQIDYIAQNSPELTYRVNYILQFKDFKLHAKLEKNGFTASSIPFEKDLAKGFFMQISADAKESMFLTTQVPNVPYSFGFINSPKSFMLYEFWNRTMPLPAKKPNRYLSFLEQNKVKDTFEQRLKFLQYWNLETRKNPTFQREQLEKFTQICTTDKSKALLPWTPDYIRDTVTPELKKPFTSLGSDFDVGKHLAALCKELVGVDLRIRRISND